MKPRIKIADTQFSHTPGGSFGAGDLCIPPTHFDWYRGTENINDIVVVTESCFHLVDKTREKTKIALIIEPPLINVGSYHWIRDNHHKFQWVLTYNTNMLDVHTSFHWYPFGGCWIRPEEQQVYDKTRQLSIIASGKHSTVWHELRHDVIKELGTQMSIYGNGYNRIDNKLTGLRDYRYNIVIENDPCNGFFSEKLIDCFRTGTIPIFCGNYDAVRDCFDIGGMCFFNSVEELKNNLPLWDEKYYYSRIQYVQRNFELAEAYTKPEDWLWHNFFVPRLGM